MGTISTVDNELGLVRPYAIHNKLGLGKLGQVVNTEQSPGVRAEE